MFLFVAPGLNCDPQKQEVMPNKMALTHLETDDTRLVKHNMPLKSYSLQCVQIKDVQIQAFRIRIQIQWGWHIGFSLADIWCPIPFNRYLSAEGIRHP